MNLGKCLPPKLAIATTIIFIVFWGCSATRHALLQSNAYDLGLFDQWIWLASKGLPPYSSMEGVHLLADHGAWTLYIAAIAYKFYPSIQWLFASQAGGLALTAIPLWHIGKIEGLSNKLCWLVCGIWWLQPVVFNVNLFDFHPEVWTMPALAGSYWANRTNKPLIWFSLLLLLLGSRDGLVLIVAGLGLEQALRRKWSWAGAALGLALGWLGILNRLLYPYLTGDTKGPKAVESLFSYLGNSFEEILLNLVTKPALLIEHLDWIGALIYLLLISISTAHFWRKKSFLVLTGAMPLVIVNLLSQSAPQRTLIHHYSLPIAVVSIIAVIDGLANDPRQDIPWKKLVWTSICWAALAKPWFFTGPYLERFNTINDSKEAISQIKSSDRVTSTSYLIPHLSQREKIDFPRENETYTTLEDIDILLLNPNDPGWGSSKNKQLDLINQAKIMKWKCESWKRGLELCKRNQ